MQVYNLFNSFFSRYDTSFNKIQGLSEILQSFTIKATIDITIRERERGEGGERTRRVLRHDAMSSAVIAVNFTDTQAYGYSNDQIIMCYRALC
jgi:hypothetical protein